MTKFCRNVTLVLINQPMVKLVSFLAVHLKSQNLLTLRTYCTKNFKTREKDCEKLVLYAPLGTDAEVYGLHATLQ